MRQQDGWIFSAVGKTAVEQALVEKKRTMRWLWEIKLKRPQSNWYNATGKSGRSTALRTLHEILDAVGLKHDAAYFERNRPRSPEPEAPKAAPAARGKLSRNLPNANPFFTGRQDILERLHQALAIGDAALVPFPQALTGMGGIGKTQTAIAYAHRYRRDYRGVYWVEAETAESLNAGLAALAPELDPPVPLHAQQDATLRAVRDWFAEHSDWLLILDNADDLKHLAEDFPPHHNGRLLLTTRAHATGKIAQPVRIAKLALEDGALLLLRRAQILEETQGLDAASQEDREAALALSAEVDGLPLALDHAGAYLEERHITPLEYLSLYQSRGLELLDETADRDHKSVSITFSLAFQQLEKLPEIGAAAANFVRLCAFLAPDAIPEEIFTSGQFALDGLPAPLDREEYRRVRAAVLAYSLLNRDVEPRTLSIHRLLQGVIRGQMTSAERETWSVQAVVVVSAASPDGLFPNWPACQRLLAQWRVCEKMICDVPIETAAAAYLLRQAGTYHSERLNYDEAETLLKRSLDLYDRKHADRHEEAAVLCNNFGTLRVKRGNYAEARRMMLRAVAHFKRAPAATRLQMAQVMHNLGSLYLAQKRCEKAALFFRRVGPLRAELLGAENVITASTDASLAYVYFFQKRYAESEALFNATLKIYATQPDAAPLERAAILSNRAALFIELGRFSEAEADLELALQIRGAHQRTEDAEAGQCRRRSAQAWAGQGRFAEADAEHQRAIEILTRTLGAGHPAIARAEAEYAAFLEKIGRPEEAEA